MFHCRDGNRCIEDPTISPSPLARRQVLPPSEWYNIFHRRQTNERTNRQTDDSVIAFIPAFASAGLTNVAGRLYANLAPCPTAGADTWQMMPIVLSIYPESLFL